MGSNSNQSYPKEKGGSEWILVNRKKSRKQDSPTSFSRRGTAEISDEENKNGLSGTDKRVWLYINRVKKHVTSDMIETFIKKKSGFENCKLQILKLDPDSEKTTLTRFLVIARFEKKGEIYEPSFWPQNVGIKRFHF
ncbi:hypothetical protein HHI36_006894 [Cryptolaemus montrouzieri]|uniref:Uncharacterized protein n=1 Tax=Cryptolaemus montrouzieri TaxID=559131 RepID=A0ABD2MN47_9CUCU